MKREDKVWSVIELLSKLLTFAILLTVVTGAFTLEVSWERADKPIPLPQLSLD